MSTFRTRLARVSLAGASTTAIVALLEIPVLFGYDYQRLFGGPSTAWLQISTGVQERDPELLLKHKPHSRFTGVVVGNLVAPLEIPDPSSLAVDVRYDAHGFRNDTDLTSADVVVIGDSFVEGAETPQPQTMVAHVGRELRMTAANLGQANYGPQQELVVLERYGLSLAPRMVVWAFFGGNDLSNVDDYEALQAHPEQLAPPPALTERLLSGNVLRTLSRLTTPERPEVMHRAWLHRAVFTRADGSQETLYLDRPDAPWTPHQWQVATSVLRRARDAAHGAGAGFLLVYVPRKLSVYRGSLDAPPGTHAHTWPQGELPQALRQFCAEERIEFLDATEPLRTAVTAGESVYLAEDAHWNAAGHRVVGMAVAGRIRSLIAQNPDPHE